MRGPAYCGVCNLWLRGGLSNHNRGKRHNALLNLIDERLATIISEAAKVSAPSIVADVSQQDERDQQSKQ